MIMCGLCSARGDEEIDCDENGIPRGKADALIRDGEIRELVLWSKNIHTKEGNMYPANMAGHQLPFCI